MVSACTLRDFGRGLLVAACSLVLVVQLMATAMAASSHLSVKFVAGEILLAEICGTTPKSKGDAATHVEGVNTCCVWAKSVPVEPLVPPVCAAAGSVRTEPAPISFGPQPAPFAATEQEEPPKATGPPLHH